MLYRISFPLAKSPQISPSMGQRLVSPAQLKVALSSPKTGIKYYNSKKINTNLNNFFLLAAGLLTFKQSLLLAFADPPLGLTQIPKSYLVEPPVPVLILACSSKKMFEPAAHE
jgi:hypothetical protein